MKPQCQGYQRRGVSFVLLLLSIIFLAVFIWDDLLTKGSGLSQPSLNRIQVVLFLLISITLLWDICLQLHGALREWIQMEEVPTTQDHSSEREYSYQGNGSIQTLLLHCIEILESNFRRYHAFHHYQHPHVRFYFLAKRGSISLFALPWAKTGFLFLFVIYLFDVSKGVVCSPALYGLIVLATALCFWVPSIIIYILVPYQKLWLCIVEEGGVVHLTLTCSTPFSSARLDSLCSSVRQAFSLVFREVPAGRAGVPSMN